MQRTTTYREQSRIFLAQAYEELAKGDLPQASEKGSGAAAQMVKAVAQQRGWPHSTDRELYGVVSALRLELIDPELSVQFSAASSLRVNFCENWFAAQDVEDHIRRVEKFLSRLQKLLPPSPEKPSKKQESPATREQSRLLLAQARQELSKGYLVEASEKGWLAAFEMAKVLSQERGCHHDDYRDLHIFIGKLSREIDDLSLLTQFGSGFALYTNASDNLLPREFVEHRLSQVKLFVEKAEGLLETTPKPPSSPPPLTKG